MKRKIVVFGAGGIVGQHMIKFQPKNFDAVYTKRSADGPYIAFSGSDNVFDFLNAIDPDVIINLSGENSVDVVESSPDMYWNINVKLPKQIANWTDLNKRTYLHVSTQGVFSGENSPYSPGDLPDPITQYGKQKFESEKNVFKSEFTKIIRLTFVLGVRPFQNFGRRNPLEDMIENKNQLQVNDRFFSPLFAQDAAQILWEEAEIINLNNKIMHLGNPVRCSRFSISSDLKYHTHGAIENKILPVSHEYFTGIAARPKDTTWASGTSIFKQAYEEGLLSAYFDWRNLNK